jgi:predicted TIM-barrel enzyme
VSDRPIPEQARDAEFFAADGLIATGTRTGDGTPPEEITRLRDGSSLPIYAGSGLSLGNVDEIMQLADGAIVGSSLKVDGRWWNPVERQRVSALMERVQALR